MKRNPNPFTPKDPNALYAYETTSMIRIPNTTKTLLKALLQPEETLGQLVTRLAQEKTSPGCDTEDHY